MKTGLTILGQCKAPFRFWNYAFETLVYLINRMLNFILANRSPFDCLFHCSTYYHILRTFGCLYFPFLRSYNNHKLNFLSFPCVFYDYSSSHLGYQCFDIESYHMYIFCHVCFHEHVFPFDNFEQIAQVLAQNHTLFPATIVPNLTHTLLFTDHDTPHPASASTLHSPPTKTPQSLPFPCRSPYTFLSHHSVAGIGCRLVFPTLHHDVSTSIGKPFSSSFASPLFCQSPSFCRLCLCCQPCCCWQPSV